MTGRIGQEGAECWEAEEERGSSRNLKSRKINSNSKNILNYKSA